MNTTKKCTSCGAPNEILIDKCVYCKSQLPIVNTDGLSIEEMLEKCAHWLAMYESVSNVANSLGYLIDAPEGYKQRDWGLSGKIYKYLVGNPENRILITKEEITNNFKKYVYSIKIKSISNNAVNNIILDFEKRFKKQQFKLIFKNQFILLIVGYLIFMIILWIIAKLFS